MSLANTRSCWDFSLRDDVFPLSGDVIGAISQVIHYRESLMDDLAVRHAADLSSSDPRCLLIAGSAQRELTDEFRKRSFERFRERLVGVTIVTFDEVFERVRALSALFD